MKKHLFFLTVFAGLAISSVKASNTPAPTAMTVDQNDTVVFDLSQAVVNGSTLEFPVSILSDDSVYALDFSFKYDHLKLAYDTILNRTTYMSALSFYNVNDSTVRFTSNSSHRYTNDTVLATVRFTILAGPLMESDITSVLVYLNGDPCSLKVTPYLINAVQPVASVSKEMLLFPNPSEGEVFVRLEEPACIRISDMDGREMYRDGKERAAGFQRVDTDRFPAGMYILQLITARGTVSKRLFVVSH